MERFVRSARDAAFVASAAIALVGLFAGAVRVLPWLLDPAVPWPVAAPFARGLAAVAFEAALLVGWPVGWALACLRLVESGEARVLQTLGESPRTTALRLAPQGLALALALGAAALVYGSDAGAPGRVATELLETARSSCASVDEPKSYTVPFTNMTWLCVPGRTPRLVGAPPGALASAVVTAEGARIAGDFRALQLSDARVLLPGLPAAGGEPRRTVESVSMHVGTLTMHGMAPWAHASSLPAPLRSLVLAMAASVSAALAAYAVLRRAARTRLGALALGAAGPVASLGLMRWFETARAAAWAFALLPLAAAACTYFTASLFVLARRSLRRRGPAASTWIKL